MSNYQIRKTDGTTLLTLIAGTIDNKSTALTLVGKKYPDFGRIFNENDLHLLENFANTSPPPNPLTGQMWYNTAARRPEVFNGFAWVPINRVKTRFSYIRTISPESFTDTSVPFIVYRYPEVVAHPQMQGSVMTGVSRVQSVALQTSRQLAAGEVVRTRLSKSATTTNLIVAQSVTANLFEGSDVTTVEDASLSTVFNRNERLFVYVELIGFTIASEGLDIQVDVETISDGV